MVLVGVILFIVVLTAASVTVQEVRHVGMRGNETLRVLIPFLCVTIPAVPYFSRTLQHYEVILVNDSESDYLVSLGDESFESGAHSLRRIRVMGSTQKVSFLNRSAPSDPVLDALKFPSSGHEAIINIEKASRFIEERVAYHSKTIHALADARPPFVTATLPVAWIAYSDADYVLVDPPEEIKVPVQVGRLDDHRRHVRKLE